MGLDPNIEKLLFNEEGQIKNLSDLYDTVVEQDSFKFLSDIGYHFEKVIDYGNKYNIDDDPFTKSIINIVGVAFYNGVAPLIQLELGLYLSEVYNLEYEHALKIRSFLELVAKVHKGTRLIQSFFKNSNDISVLQKGSSRLIARYIPDKTSDQLRKVFDAYKKSQNIEYVEEGFKKLIAQSQKQNVVRSYGITSLIDSLKNVIPDIDSIYNDLSNYLHGDFKEHYLNRRFTFFMAKTGKQSLVINKNKELQKKFEDVIVSDLKYLKKVTQPLADRIDNRNKQESTKDDQRTE